MEFKVERGKHNTQDEPHASRSYRQHVLDRSIITRLNRLNQIAVGATHWIRWGAWFGVHKEPVSDSPRVSVDHPKQVRGDVDHSDAKRSRLAVL